MHRRPEYIVHGEDIMLKFTALESALIDQPKAPNVREVDRDDISENERNVLSLILADPEVTAAEMADKLSLSRKTVERCVRKLKEKRIIERVGSDRKGYWRIKE